MARLLSQCRGERRSRDPRLGEASQIHGTSDLALSRYPRSRSSPPTALPSSLWLRSVCLHVGSGTNRSGSGDRGQRLWSHLLLLGSRNLIGQRRLPISGPALCSSTTGNPEGCKIHFYLSIILARILVSYHSFFLVSSVQKRNR